MKKDQFQEEHEELTVEDLLRAEKVSFWGLVTQILFAIILLTGAFVDFNLAEVFLCNFQGDHDPSCPPFNLIGLLIFTANGIAIPFQLYGFLCAIVSWTKFKLPKIGRKAPIVYIAFLYTLGVHIYGLCLSVLGCFYCFTDPDKPEGCIWTVFTIIMVGLCTFGLLLTALKHWRVHRKRNELEELLAAQFATV